MITFIKTFLFFILFSFSASAQQITFQDSLLGNMTGKWILKGTIGEQNTTHDINVDWVLGHQYLQINEVSREKNVDGSPQYEAIVYIGWDQPLGQYDCLWLDVTGGSGLSAPAIGHAERNHDEIAFLFKGNDGSNFHTTFAYNKESDSWQWLMDNEENGKLQPFARVLLTRK
jgi:hypothetical protein